MEHKIKITLVAAAVAAVLSGTAIAATPALPGKQALPNFDRNATLNRGKDNAGVGKKSHRTQAAGQVRAGQKKNSLNGKGIKFAATNDHFDKSLNTTTFSWAQGEKRTAAQPFAVLQRSAAITRASNDYVAQAGAKHGVSATAFAQSELKYVSENKHGAIISKYQQKVNGIEVHGRQFNVLMNQNLALVATTGYFSNAIAPQQSKAGQFKLSADAAIRKAFADIGGDEIKLDQADKKANYQVFSASSGKYSFSAQPRGKMVYYPGQKKLIPAWYVELMVAKNDSKSLIAYSHVISAVDGEVLNRTNMVQSEAFTYKAFADASAPYAPFDSPLGNDLTPHPTGVYDDEVIETTATMNDVTLENAGISTNDPWLPAGATTTSGNNVDAYADLVAPDGFGAGDLRAATTSANTFDHSHDPSDKVNTPDNINAAIVNLFYVNNYLHDVYYDHGFDEAAGVAQMDNFGRGGIDGDPLHVEAQDYLDINNANMATPLDGASPRMQMYLWQTDTIRDGTMDNAIVAHEWGHYLSHRLTNSGMYANSQGSGMGEGWGDFVALMFMLRQSDQTLPGNDLWQAAYNDGGYAVNNGFVEHAHFFGLRRAPYSTNMAHNALTFKHIEDQVEFPASQPVSNAHSAWYELAGTSNSQVHNSGEIWALMLWESYVALLNREALSYAEAQSRMMDYIVASMKITPFAPTFTEARDALLAVALANDVADRDVMRVAFAKRGMGIAAVSPDRADPGWDKTTSSQGHAGVVESFDAMGSAVAFDSVTLDNQSNTSAGAFCDQDGVLDAGETSLLSVSIKNLGTDALPGIKAQLSSSADVTFANDGIIDFDELGQWLDTTSGSIGVTLNAAGVNEVIDITVTLLSDDPEVILPVALTTSVNVNYDLIQDRETENFETKELTWLSWDRTMAVETGEDPDHFISQWEVYDDVDFGYVVFGPNLSQSNDISLLTPEVTVADSGAFSMTFDHYYYFEFGDFGNPDDETPWDGGVMEIRIDGGPWTDVVAAGGTFDVGYTGTITEFNPVLAGRDGFVSLIEEFWIDDETLSFAEGSLNGKTVQFRFRIGSDTSVAAWGWNIDNIAYINATTATPFFSLVEDSGTCVNRPPLVVDVEAPASVIEAGIITLSVTGQDHDGAELSYIWSQTSGSTAIDVSSTAATLTFAAPLVSADEVYSFSVIATDGELTSEPRAVSVTIIANVAPVLSTTQSDVSVMEKQSLTLMVEGSDAEGDALVYTWISDGIAVTSPSNSFDYTAPAVSEDTLVVFDVSAFDGIDNSEEIQISVNVIANQPPVVTTEQATLSVEEGGSVTLMVSGSDPENDSLTYQWSMDGVAIDSSGNSYGFTAPDVDEDTLVVFSVIAFDGDESSEAAVIEVNIIANQPPVIIADEPALTIREGETVTLSVTGSDPEGDSLSYQWTMDGEVVGGSGNSYEFTAPSVNTDTTVSFGVIASDGQQSSTSAQISVTVENRSSGGGMGLFALLLAPLAFIRRRKRG